MATKKNKNKTTAKAKVKTKAKVSVKAKVKTKAKAKPKKIAAKSIGTQKITPFLWFDGNAEEAINFYTSLFRNSNILNRQRMGDQFFSGTFTLNGQQFMAMNGGPMYKFSEAISFFVSCETQAEIDTLYDTLSEGGEKQRCGWLKDKFGVSWQIIPSILGKLLWNNDPQKSQRVMQAMMQMQKIDIQKLKDAQAQE